MAWSNVPVSVGAVVQAAAIGEIREAIIERRRAAGLGPTAGGGDPPAVSAGAVATAATINAYRQSIESMIGRYLNPGDFVHRWDKENIIRAALGEERVDWTNRPARAGGLVEDTVLPAGNVMYAEHLNDLKAVLDKLYVLEIEEQPGRQYAVYEGSGWSWSETGGDPSVTAEAHANARLGTPANERAASAPYDFVYEPVGTPKVKEVKAKGVLMGTDLDLTVKDISFYGQGNGPQPSDRTWNAQMRMGEHRPTDSPRGPDTTTFYGNDLSDNDQHTSDSKNNDPNELRVFVSDNWSPVTVPAPGVATWPYWVTYVLDDYGSVVGAYAAEAAATDRSLWQWWGSAYLAITHMWAEMDFDYLTR
jgi:hypothetical protein